MTTSATLTNRLCVDIENIIFQYLDFETLEKTRHLQSDYVKMVTKYGTILSAIANNNIANLKWLKSIGYEFPLTAFLYAILSGNYSTLLWLEENNCPKNGKEVIYAACIGNLEFVKFFFKRGYKCDDAFYYAADKGHLNIMKWFLENGFKLDETIFTAAAKNGNLDNIKWLYENRCPINTEHLFIVFIHINSIDGLIWTRNLGYQLNELTFSMATYIGNLNVMKWLHANECPWNELTFDSAETNGNLDNIKWLLENNCPFHNDTYQRIMNF